MTITKPDIFDIAITKLHPSQLFLNAEKLKRLENTADHMSNFIHCPIPILRMDNLIVMTDGHTRAFAMFKKKQTKLWVRWETDKIDIHAYRICVKWCREAGIYLIGDLENRIVSDTEYQTVWIQRCQDMHEQLEQFKA